MATQRPPDEPSDQVKKDIEEILSRMGEGDEDEPREPLRVAAPRPPRIVRPRTRLGSQPGALMALGAVLLVLAIVVAPLRLAFAVAGMALLGIGYWISWQSGRTGPRARRAGRGGSSEVRYWRGQRIESDSSRHEPGNVVHFRETWTSRLRRWWRSRR